MRFLWILFLLVMPGWEPTHPGDPVIIGETHRIHSAVLDEDRTYEVSLPVSYRWATDRQYPVLYLLDGKAHFAHTAGSVGFLSAEGEIPEMIVVAIASTVRVRDFTQSDWPEAWIGGGGADRFKLFLSTELIPEVERTFRVDGFRVLSGHSAGGQFVLHCLASEPPLFRAYVALSPSLDWDHNLPQRELEASFMEKPRLDAFLYVARSDDSGRPLADFDRLVETLDTRSPEGFRWHSRAFDDETHGSIGLLGQIDALRHVYDGYRFHDDLLGGGLPAVERHFAAASRTVGWPLPIPEGIINNLAYDALSNGDAAAATSLFRRNTESNPNSANAFDSLADGLAEASDWDGAVAASNRAVELAREFDHPDLVQFESQNRKWSERAAAALKSRN